MNEILLSPRLQAVSDFVSAGDIVADIGTDHGYLPAYLLQHHISPKVFASDIREGPLSSAKKTAAELSLSEGIQFALADGLQGIEPLSVNTVIIAGMGGETIADILNDAPWVSSPGVKLILQPQTKVEVLVKWLDEHEFSIRDICLVRDAGRFYVVMMVLHGNVRLHHTYAECVIDRLLLEKRDPLLPEYLERILLSVQKRIAGLEKSNHAHSEEYAVEQENLREFLAIKEEVSRW